MSLSAKRRSIYRNIKKLCTRVFPAPSTPRLSWVWTDQGSQPAREHFVRRGNNIKARNWYRITAQYRLNCISETPSPPTMSDLTRRVRVAVTQHEPAWLNLGEAVEKTCAIIKEASEKGASLVTFPECWIPGKFCTSVESASAMPGRRHACADV